MLLFKVCAAPWAIAAPIKFTLSSESFLCLACAGPVEELEHEGGAITPDAILGDTFVDACTELVEGIDAAPGTADA
jgi:hypothetical protein